MDIHEIRSFIVLAEQLHFGRAAQILHLSQPALTKQIRKIELELGGDLFERGTHGTKLSSLGVNWLPEAQSAVSRFDQLLVDGKEGAAGRVGNLRIGFGFSTLEFVPEVIVSLRARSPRVQIMLQDMSTREQVAALRENLLDVGFVRMPVKLGGGYSFLPVVQDRLELAVSTRERGKAPQGLEDCRDQPFVMISHVRSPGFFGHVLRLCAARGYHPRIVQEVYEFTTALALVRAGMGVTIVPESMRQNQLPGVRRRRIPEREAAWSVSAAWRSKDSNPVLADFLDILKQVPKVSQLAD